MRWRGFQFYNMEHLLTISEITVQYRPKKANRPKITTSYEAMTIARQFFPADTIELQERFVVIYLNRANRVIGIYPVSVGGITGTVADIRLILSVALKAAATGIILVHNHPSGNLKPSNADILLSPDDSIYHSFADEGII